VIWVLKSLIDLKSIIIILNSTIILKVISQLKKIKKPLKEPIAFPENIMHGLRAMLRL
jgi:hypothetical protein